MKSAKHRKSIWTTLVLFFTICSLISSCVGCSRFSFLSREEGKKDPATDTDSEDDLPVITPADPPPKTVYYNRYTGLACDEAILSCRPISVCIGNFDEKRQEGLSFADILIEAPHEGDKTRVLALYTDHARADTLSGVSSIKDYMLPPVTAFGAIASFAGNSDKRPGETPASNVDYLDCYYHNLSSAFSENAEGLLTTNIKALAEASAAKGYAVTDQATALPYQLAELDTIFTPNSNRIRNISFRFSAASSVSFTYDDTARLYFRSQNGEAHTDRGNGKQLEFSNLLLLFHNVSYYHTSSTTSFTLDTKKGGDGYLYTGGGVVSVRWSYRDDGTLSIVDENGEKITVNRGKTYIGMLRVTDSSTLVAK